MQFTSRQVTTMVVALCAVAVLLPVGAYAVGTAVNIVDATSGSKARVNASGQLWTVNVDPTTGARSKVDGAGKQLVGDGSGSLTIDGVVSRTVPAKPLSATGVLAANGVHQLKWGAGRTALTDLVSWQRNDSGLPLDINLRLYADGGAGNCTSLGSLLTNVGNFRLPNNSAPVTIHFSTPIVAAGPGTVCLRVVAGELTNVTLHYTVSGFDV